MIYFNCDYLEGAHPNILKRISETNNSQEVGYGYDRLTEEGKVAIRKACQDDNVDVYFINGGTQTNIIAISSVLKPYQGVISGMCGHINTHETGALEATGHKVLPIPHKNGKIKPGDIRYTYDAHFNQDYPIHEVQPAMVYITNPTEYGTIYSRSELQAISDTCKSLGLYLFLDGARLGYGLTCEDNELDIPFIKECCDLFYIGGTKCGAMFGEALVIVNDSLKKDFGYNIKHRCALVAKGRFLGIQFAELFKDNLYFEISKHANRMADKIKDTLKTKGYEMFMDSPTNLIFVVIPNRKLKELEKEFYFEKTEDHSKYGTVVRIVTSWATKEEDVDKLIAAL